MKIYLPNISLEGETSIKTLKGPIPNPKKIKFEVKNLHLEINIEFY
jgi:hypothetical protein